MAADRYTPETLAPHLSFLCVPRHPAHLATRSHHATGVTGCPGDRVCGCPSHPAVKT